MLVRNWNDICRFPQQGGFKATESNRKSTHFCNKAVAIKEEEEQKNLNG